MRHPNGPRPCRSGHPQPGPSMAPDTQMKRHEAQPPVAIARAQGPRLCDTDGRRYLDGIRSSWRVNLLGHPMSRLALAEQVAPPDHVVPAGFTHAPGAQLSKRLGALTGLGHAFYGSDGAAATESGLKMSAHHWRNIGRPAKRRLSVGRAVTTVRPWARWPWPDIALFRAAYAPLVRLAVTVPRPDARGTAPGETPQPGGGCGAVAASTAWSGTQRRRAEVAATQAPLPQGRICQQSMDYVYARYLNE